MTSIFVKNTFLMDVLEYFNVVHIHEPLPEGQTANSESDLEKQVTNMGQDSLSSSGSGEDSTGAADGQGEYGSVLQKNGTDPFLVDWYGPQDPDYPVNWTMAKKIFLVIQIMLLTCLTYMGSSIYTPGQEEIQKDFHVGHVTATLNLSMYVLGYGLGPIIFSPLSEVAKFGRQQIYIYTFFLFMVFQVGCATVKNIGGLVVLRFFSGILCSPSLATGGATMGDIVEAKWRPVLIGLWAIGAVAAPVLAPLLGAAMVVAKNWRWIFWLMLWMCGASLILFVICFPETSANNILSRRARRLRKQTGDDRYYTTQERIDSAIEPKQFLITTLYRPIKMILLEPIIMAFDLYIALCYGAFYLFFEAFPIVFIGLYKFTLVEMGVAYFGFCVGCIFAYALLLLFLAKVLGPRFEKGEGTPETFLLLAMCVSWCLPCALFLFGWAANTHWIVPIIAEGIFVIAVFNLFQASFAYLSVCYPKYVASVFAGNGFCRAVFACAFPLFGKAMYDNLAIDGYPVGWGSSLVGFITMFLAAIPFVLYKYGPALRAKSRFKD
ncbi:Flr1p KNAG_0F03480 [Huiozyma naganishii CBS 8797]|uniref:Major facilitator superfamily (MFS) profile domain-containing protein n=1 Tax=Huiozyma naganishii (strain ATCC MYA-139 / BCRC 22969 / CBS 8797 / KCTC 17520 / NBRC 10181 / NCYC 3082 / Yp74L-3) TaxID=1071383 RepID=J7R833_HUIN7|nr:hypothetical protein KNAG_0F03480 [Kazachstania naganishii CBS 8797]CCK71010.1 hypothetical protein KNAG_0F03480 [Kazachstania naganishii CBS 8797]